MVTTPQCPPDLQTCEEGEFSVEKPAQVVDVSDPNETDVLIGNEKLIGSFFTHIQYNTHTHYIHAFFVLFPFLGVF